MGLARALLQGSLVVAVACLLLLAEPTGALVNGVTRATHNGTTLQDSVEFLVREHTENLLYGLSTGGIVYRIDVSTMATSSLQLTSGDDDPGQPLGLHIDDGTDRLYAVFYSTSLSSSVAYIINTANFTSIASRAYTLVVQEFNVTRDVLSVNPFRYFTTLDIVSAVSGVSFDQANDKLHVWGHYDKGGSVFTNRIWSFDNYQAITDATDFGASSRITGNNAFTTVAGNYKFVGGPQFSTNTSNFVPHRSTASRIRQGSAIVQFPRPANVISTSYTPQAFFVFPSENNIQTISIDQPQSVLFIGNSLGEIRKYRFSDLG